MGNFLNVNLAPTLGQLAEGQPSLIASLGAEVQRAQKQQREEQTHQMQQQLGEMQLEQGQIELMNQRAQQSGSFANSMMETYPDEATMAQNWAAERERMIQENPALAKAIPEEFPGMAGVGQMREKSLTVQEAIRRDQMERQLDIQERQLQQRQREATAKAQKEKEAKRQKKEITEGQITSFLEGRTKGGKADTSWGSNNSYANEMSKTDLANLNRALQSRVNQLMAADPTLNREVAQEMAMDEIEQSGAIVEGSGTNDFAFNQDIYLGKKQGAAPTPGTGTAPAGGDNEVSDAALGL